MLSLKGNQGRLHEDVRDYFQEREFQEKIKRAGCYKRVKEKAHGQIETREYYQTEDVAWLEQRRNWKCLKSIVMERKRIERGNEKRREYRYFISSLSEDIERISNAVRGHWSIESMHWHLDVTFREDANTTIDKRAAQNQNIIRKWCLSILKLSELSTRNKRLSMKKKRFAISLRPVKLLEEILNS